MIALLPRRRSPARLLTGEFFGDALAPGSRAGVSDAADASGRRCISKRSILHASSRALQSASKKTPVRAIALSAKPSHQAEEPTIAFSK